MKMLNYNNFSNKINENLLKNITNYISHVFDFLYDKFKQNMGRTGLEPATSSV